MTIQRRLASLERAHTPRTLPQGILGAAWSATERAEVARLWHRAMDGEPAAMSTARLLAAWAALGALGTLLATRRARSPAD